MVRFRSLAVSLLVAVSGAVLPPAGTAIAAQVPPGGRQYFTVAQGRLGTSGTNWVRLSYYNFRTDGIVGEGFYQWSSDNEQGKVALPVPICDSCTQYEPYGFGTDGVAGTRTGHYDPIGTDGIVRVTWDNNAGSETWTIDPTRPLLTELSLRSSTVGASVGHAFGSIQPSTYGGAPIGDTYSYMAAHGLASMSLGYFSRGWFRRDNTLNDNPGPYILNGPGKGTLCSATCLKTVGSEDHYYYQNQSAVLPRNLAMETWKSTLDTSGDGCYQDGTDGTNGVTGPHVFGGITVVDDAGGWRGFVRVEASLFPDRDTDYMSVAWASTDTLGI